MKKYIEPKLDFYENSLDCLLNSLDEANDNVSSWDSDWNK